MKVLAIQLTEPLGEMGYAYRLQVGTPDGIARMALAGDVVMVYIHGPQFPFAIPVSRCKIIYFGEHG